MRSVLVPVLGLLVVTACHTGSLEQLYLAKDVVPAPATVVGTWTQQGDETPAVLKVQEAKDHALAVLLEVDGDGIPLNVVPFKLGTVTYVDLQLDDTAANVKPLASYMVRPHFLARVEMAGDSLTLWLPEKAFLAKLASGKAAMLKGRPTGGADDKEMLLLSSSTAELQTALKKHAGAKGAWGEPILFKRLQ